LIIDSGKLKGNYQGKNKISIGTTPYSINDIFVGDD